MLNKILATLLSILFIFSSALNISAEQVTYYSENGIREFLDLYSTDRKKAWRYISDTWGPWEGEAIEDEFLSMFKNQRDVAISFVVEGTVFEKVKEADIVFKFFTSDAKAYIYKHDIKKRNVLTLKEIVEKSGVPDSQKIEFCYISCLDKLYFSFWEYETGFYKINNKDYYIKPDGTMITKSCIIDGIRYKFTSDGVCMGKYKGWTKNSKGRRYWNNGIVVTKRNLIIDGIKYHADEDGYVTILEE